MNFTDELNALTPNSVRVVAVPPAPAPAPPAATSVADPHGFNNLGAPPKLPSNIVDIFGDSGNLEKVTLSGGATSQAQLQRAAQVGEQDAAIAAQVALAKAAGQAENPVSKVLTTSLKPRTSVVEFPSLYNVRPSHIWKDMSFAQACDVIMPAEPAQCESKAAAPLIIGGSLQVAALSDAAQKAYDEAGETHDGRGLARSNANIYQLDMAIGDIDGRFTSVISELERLNISTGAYSSASYQPNDPLLDKGRVLCAVTRPIKPAELPAFFEGFNAVCLGALDESGRKPAQGYVPYIATPTSTESIRKEFGEFALDVDAVMRIGTKVLGSPRLGNAVSVATVYKPSMERSSAFWQLVENTEAALSLLDLEGVDNGWSDWLRTGFALKEELGDREGFRLWNSWSEKFDNYDGLAKTQKEWRRLNISEDCDTRGTCGGIISRAGNRAASYFNTVLAPGGVYVPPGGFGAEHWELVDLQVKFLDFAFNVFPLSRLYALVPSLPADLTALNVPVQLAQRVAELGQEREYRVFDMGRVRVEYVAQGLDTILKQIGEAVSRRVTHDPYYQLYNMSGTFSTVEEVSGLKTTNLKTTMHTRGEHSLGTILSRHVIIWQTVKTPKYVNSRIGDGKVTLYPRRIERDFPNAIATAFTGYGSKVPTIPVLTQITGSPILVGTRILEKRGYDQKSGIFCWPPEYEKFDAVVPYTREQAQAAMKAVDRILLKDFAFVDAYDDPKGKKGDDILSRSAAHSLLMTAVVGISLDMVPLHAVTAEEAGSGKSELTKLATSIARAGKPKNINVVEKSNGQPDHDELSKTVNTRLFAGEWILALDNVNGPFNSGILSSLSTDNGNIARVLGKSLTRDVEGAKMITLNGNKLRVAEDLADKTLVAGIRRNPKLWAQHKGVEDLSDEALDALHEASMDTFLAKVQAKRAKWLPLLLSVSLGFQVALQRRDRAALVLRHSIDTSRFKRWEEAVRCPILWATGTDPWDSRTRAMAQSPEKVAIAELLGLLAGLRRCGVIPRLFTSKEVIAVCGLGDHAGDPKRDPRGFKMPSDSGKSAKEKQAGLAEFIEEQEGYRDTLEGLLTSAVASDGAATKKALAMGRLLSQSEDSPINGTELKQKAKSKKSKSVNRWYLDSSTGDSTPDTPRDVPIEQARDEEQLELSIPEPPSS